MLLAYVQPIVDSAQPIVAHVAVDLHFALDLPFPLVHVAYLASVLQRFQVVQEQLQVVLLQSVPYWLSLVEDPLAPVQVSQQLPVDSNQQTANCAIATHVVLSPYPLQSVLVKVFQKHLQHYLQLQDFLGSVVLEDYPSFPQVTLSHVEVDAAD